MFNQILGSSLYWAFVYEDFNAFFMESAFCVDTFIDVL